MGLLLREGQIDLSKLDEAVDAYWSIHDIQEPKLQEKLRTKQEWVDQLQNDLLCILYFVQEKNFVADAIEFIGCWDADKNVPISFAGAIDLVGTLTFNGKRKRAIVDLKTGGLYDDQGFQLMANKLCWDQANPDHPVEMLFNLSPGKATSQKKYELKNRKIDDYKDDFMDYAKIAGRNCRANPKPFFVPGIVSRESDLSELVVSPDDYVKNKHS